MTIDNDISSNSEILHKLQEKKDESDRFIHKYQSRKMNDLEEYYKGASWAFDFMINIIKKEL
mgnify:CR=1 FL=1